MNNIDTASSSESEIDSCVQIKAIKGQRCLICKTAEASLNATDRSFYTFLQSTKFRNDINKNTDVEIQKAIYDGTSGNLMGIYWHKNCYIGYTSKKSIEVLRKRTERLEKYKEAGIEPPQPPGRTLRKMPFDIDKCVFCQKRSTQKRLSQVMSTNIENKIKRIACKSSEVLQRIGLHDLISMEVKYHPNCLTVQNRKFCKQPKYATAGNMNSEANKPLEKIIIVVESGIRKGKAFTATSIYNRLYYYYIEAATSSHDSPLFIGVSEISQIHKICTDIKAEMDGIPDFKNTPNLDIEDYMKNIPQALSWIISLLIGDEENVDNTTLLSICQDIIYTRFKGKKFTPKHVGIGISVHQETRSKKLVDVLHSCGHSVSYKDVLRLRNSIAQEEISRYLYNDNCYIPRQLVPNKFVHFAADNIDILEETLDKSPTFHGTQIMAFQKGPPNTEQSKSWKYGLPNDVALYWHQYPWVLGETFCKVRALLSEMATYVSVLTIVAFSTERYLAICYPLYLHTMSGLQRALRIIVCIWLIGLISAAPFSVYSSVHYLKYPPDTDNILEESAFCAMMSQPEHFPLAELSFFMFFLIPMCIIAMQYIKMGLRIFRQTKPGLGKGFNGSVHRGSSRRSQSHRAVIRMLAAVVIGFFVCWAPFHAQRLLVIYGQECTYFNELIAWMFYITGILYYFSSTLNPVLYNLMSNRYRNAFKEILCGIKSKHKLLRRSSTFRETRRLSHSDNLKRASNSEVIRQSKRQFIMNSTTVNDVITEEETLHLVKSEDLSTLNSFKSLCFANERNSIAKRSTTHQNSEETCI